MALVLDTGPILALLDADDAGHGACVALVPRSREALVVPSAVLVEVDYWVRQRLDASVWMAFVEDIAAGGELESTYADLRLGLVDASVIALCERLGGTKVATLDHRHFSVVRPRHCARLTLLP